MYFLYNLLALKLAVLPGNTLYFFSDILYLILYHIVGYRKNVVRTNLKNSFPEKSETERLQIEKDFYHFFCDMSLETFQTLHLSKREMKKRVSFSGLEYIEEERKKGKSVILMSGHYANWEWSSSIKLNLPADYAGFVIYQTLSSDSFDELMNNIRRRFGCTPVERDVIIRKMVEDKQKQELGYYGFVADQSPARKSIKYWMNFLNQDTPVFLGAEQLAKKFDYVVLYFDTLKIKRGYYHINLKPICLNPAQSEQFEITTKFMNLLEKSIKRDPSMWLWTHKRWKHKK